MCIIVRYTVDSFKKSSSANISHSMPPKQNKSCLVAEFCVGGRSLIAVPLEKTMW